MIDNKDLAAMRVLMKGAGAGGGGGGGGGASIDVTAKVGQTIVVKEVDANGKPTEWAAADLPSGFTERKLIHSITLEEQVDNVTLQIPYSSFNGATEFEIVMDIKKADEVTTTDTASGKLKITWHATHSTTLNAAVPTGNISYINFVKSRIQVSYATCSICNSAIVTETAVAAQNQGPILNVPNQAIVCLLASGYGATISGDYPFGSGSTFDVYLLNAKE